MVQLHIAQPKPATQDGGPRLLPRLCLLKGCERSFQPHHHLCRYCSEQCIQAARIWRRWLADQKYRATRQAKERRKQQSQRYRGRCKERPIDMNEPGNPGGEGDRKGKPGKKSCCHRPGCYTRFTPTPQTPQQKYCSPECYKAMRRVLIREQRWRERLGAGENNDPEEPPESIENGLFE